MVLLGEVQSLTHGEGKPRALAGEIGADLEALLALPALRQRFPVPRTDGVCRRPALPRKRTSPRRRAARR